MLAESIELIEVDASIVARGLWDVELRQVRGSVYRRLLIILRPIWHGHSLPSAVGAGPLSKLGRESEAAGSTHVSRLDRGCHFISHLITSPKAIHRRSHCATDHILSEDEWEGAGACDVQMASCDAGVVGIWR